MRLLHTMLRVGNLDKSIDFYTNVLGMRVLRRNDYPDGKFTLAFVGYQDEAEGAVIELTHNWDTDKYDLGSGYGHIALEVDNAYEACDKVKERGGKITREAGPMKHGTTVIAFVEDPDGYKIEFIQKKAEWTDTHDPHHPEDGRPSAAARGRARGAFRHARAARAGRGHVRDHGRRPGRGTGRAADRRGPATGDLRLRPQRALSRRAGGAADHPVQSGHHAAVRRDGRRLGRLPVGARPARPGAALPPYPLHRPGSAGPADRAQAEGFHARVVQHECDHLIGRLYPSRIQDFSKFGYTEILFPGMDPNKDD